MMESCEDEDAQKQKEVHVINDSKIPLGKIDNEVVDASVQHLLNSPKILEKQEADLQGSYDAKYSDLQAEVAFLEQEVANGTSNVNVAQVFDSSVRDSAEKLHSAKMELGSILRETVKLGRTNDSFPVRSELTQYELRLSELNRLIQEKHSQTRNLYATYNALLEIKELMFKEISLLNSINSQFHDAIASPGGQMKLISSMESILKGTQQRLRKAELEIQKEQKSCDAIKETHAAAVLKQRQFHSLLKIFQEECANYERLQTVQAST